MMRNDTLWPLKGQSQKVLDEQLHYIERTALGLKSILNMKLSVRCVSLNTSIKNVHTGPLNAK